MNTNLLQKFYKGECSEEEVQIVLDWLSSKDEKEALLDQLEAEWTDFEDAEEADIKRYNPDAILKRIHDRIEKEERGSAEEKPGISFNRDRYYALRVASVVALAFCVSFLFHLIQPLVVTPDKESSMVIVKDVPYGERKIIALEDGTKITLNAGSKISYPKQFSAEKREIILEGEAFFEVARDENRPFKVVTGEMITTVLGTSFNIKAYRDEEEMEVAVASGKVQVSQSEDTCFLLPGKAAAYQAGEHRLTVFDFDKEEVLSWKEEVLYFRDDSYEEVKKKLERWYGVEIQVTGDQKLLNWEYSGKFKEQSLENVLISIGYVKNFTYQLNGKKVKLKSI